MRSTSSAVGLLFLLLASGCAGPGGSEAAVTLKASPRPYERDIPLPEGFRLCEKSSEDWIAGPVRYLRHRYAGRANEFAVRSFYRRQMPLVRWTPISDCSLHGRCTMRFKRGSEECTISIEDVPSSLFGRVVIDVRINPAPQ